MGEEGIAKGDRNRTASVSCLTEPPSCARGNIRKRRPSAFVGIKDYLFYEEVLDMGVGRMELGSGFGAGVFHATGYRFPREEREN